MLPPLSRGAATVPFVVALFVFTVVGGVVTFAGGAATTAGAGAGPVGKEAVGLVKAWQASYERKGFGWV